MGNIKEGYGVFTYPDGHVYEGPFVNDRMPGREEGSRATEDVAPQLKLNINDLVEVESEVRKGASDRAQRGCVGGEHLNLTRRFPPRYSSSSDRKARAETHRELTSTL